MYMYALPWRHDWVLEHMHYKFYFLLFTTSNGSQDILITHSYCSTHAITLEVEFNIFHYKGSWGYCSLMLKGLMWWEGSKDDSYRSSDWISGQWCMWSGNIKGKGRRDDSEEMKVGNKKRIGDMRKGKERKGGKLGWRKRVACLQGRCSLR